MPWIVTGLLDTLLHNVELDREKNESAVREAIIRQWRNSKTPGTNEVSVEFLKYSLVIKIVISFFQTLFGKFISSQRMG